MHTNTKWTKGLVVWFITTVALSGILGYTIGLNTMVTSLLSSAGTIFALKKFVLDK